MDSESEEIQSSDIKQNDYISSMEKYIKDLDKMTINKLINKLFNIN